MCRIYGVDDEDRYNHTGKSLIQASTPMSPVLPTETSSSHTSLVELKGERSSSDDYPPSTPAQESFSVPHISPSSTLSYASLALENEKDTGCEYVTFSVTLPYTTYLTAILLGDSFPTKNPNTLVPTTYPLPKSSSNTRIQTPGMSTGAIVGIIVGLVAGFAALLGVFYVYLLRARQAKRRRRRRGRRGSSATADGELFGVE